jgi:hypothetical protein
MRNCAMRMIESCDGGKTGKIEHEVVQEQLRSELKNMTEREQEKFGMGTIHALLTYPFRLELVEIVSNYLMSPWPVPHGLSLGAAGLKL